MAVEETKEQQQVYNIFRNSIYLILIIELMIHTPLGDGNPITRFLLLLMMKFKVFNSVLGCKLMELVCVVITCIGTKAKKDLKFNLKTMVIYPVTFGITSLLLGVLLHSGLWGGVFAGIAMNRVLYAVASVLGIMAIHAGLDAVAKHYNGNIGDDRFNFENESFDQSREIVENEYSVNIPMIFYHKSKMHHGWMNIINPFRGTIVLGTPGSGKSFGIIDPFIRQHSAKGFAMMVYDYKFPTLAKTLFYQYCKNKHYGHLPRGCQFRIINFANIRYSNRINPIQSKYIPDLAAASETAATLLESLSKGGDGKKGGSEAFFQNSAENFLAAIIYFFVTFHPTGYKDGKKLKRYVEATKGNETMKLRLEYRSWSDYVAFNQDGKEVLDFYTKRGEKMESVSTDKDGLFVNLNNFSYTDINDNLVVVHRSWYEDEQGKKVEPDTITGEFSDMPHVLSFLGKPYADTFEVLMKVPDIVSLMAPFQSAYQNKANDQLEGMVGTLRVNAARLVSPEAYWVFSGDDFDLKISDPKNPSYLVIANSPEKEQVIGSLNALILNRLVTKVNSKGNLPTSIIVDELPTLYFHKIDRLIGTARSNKVSVTLGFQELPQLEADYGKVGMQKIITTCGNIFMGAARNKETLEWAQNDVFGKAKQTTKSITINDSKVSTSISEKMDYLVPAAKIADMATGWLAGQAARDFTKTDSSAMHYIDIESSEEFKTTKYFCKTNFDVDAIHNEEAHYYELPEIYTFENEKEENILKLRNFQRINKEVDDMIRELNGILSSELPQKNRR